MFKIIGTSLTSSAQEIINANEQVRELQWSNLIFKIGNIKIKDFKLLKPQKEYLLKEEIQLISHQIHQKNIN